jgi:hypothetical protein
MKDNTKILQDEKHLTVPQGQPQRGRSSIGDERAFDAAMQGWCNANA